MFFLNDLLPLNHGSLFIPCVKPGSQISTDIHIFHTDGGDWTLMLDATEEELRQKRLQQKGNELRLLRKELERMLEKANKGAHQEKNSMPLLGMFREMGEYRDVAVLFADICHFTAYSETESPEVMLKALNHFLDVMIRTIGDGAGLLDKIIGDAVMGIFGLIPTTDVSADLAVKAGMKMQENIAELNTIRRSTDLPCFDISIGIASGPVAVGMIDNRSRKTISAIGHPVNIAASLQKQARPHEILIDSITFQNIREDRRRFSTIITSENSYESFTAFSYRMIL
ncbi:adenylate/guanylate cyclase domain-containing protein [Desulfococcaceae bacterium HSG9]|nr:adenylate/guanylate cyclase domain-containing protein [Desulfococcaceae bacterium HSG9]